MRYDEDNRYRTRRSRGVRAHAGRRRRGPVALRHQLPAPVVSPQAIDDAFEAVFEAACAGGASARNAAFASIYELLRTVATHLMDGEASSPTLQPTLIVHEAWLRLTNSDAL